MPGCFSTGCKVVARLLTWMLLIVCALGGAAAWWLHQPLALAHEPLELEIEHGTTPRGVARAVVAAGVRVDAQLLYAQRDQLRGGELGRAGRQIVEVAGRQHRRPGEHAGSSRRRRRVGTVFACGENEPRLRSPMPQTRMRNGLLPAHKPWQTRTIGATRWRPPDQTQMGLRAEDATRRGGSVGPRARARAPRGP